MTKTMTYFIPFNWKLQASCTNSGWVQCSSYRNKSEKKIEGDFWDAPSLLKTLSPRHSQAQPYARAQPYSWARAQPYSWTPGGPRAGWDQGRDPGRVVPGPGPGPGGTRTRAGWDPEPGREGPGPGGTRASGARARRGNSEGNIINI